MFGRVIHPLFQNKTVNPKIRGLPSDEGAIDAALTHTAPEAFAYLESLSPERFLVGDRLSIADIAVVSNLVLFHYLGFRVDQKRFPRFATYFRHHVGLLEDVLAAGKPFAEQMGLDRGWL